MQRLGTIPPAAAKSPPSATRWRSALQKTGNVRKFTRWLHKIRNRSSYFSESEAHGCWLALCVLAVAVKLTGRRSVGSRDPLRHGF